MYKLIWIMKSVNKSIVLIYYISVFVFYIIIENNEMMMDSVLLIIMICSMKIFFLCFCYGVVDWRFLFLNFCL